MTKRVIKKKKTAERTIKELFDVFRVEKRMIGISEKTLRNYEESLKRFLQLLEYEDVKTYELNKELIYQFIEILQDKEVRSASINHYLRDLRAFFNWCWEEHYLEEPVKIQLVKGQEAVKETYTTEELKILLKKPLNDNYCEWRSWMIVNWILATGCRESTVCNIKMKDINIQEHEIVLAKTKNKKVQVIPMSTELQFALRKFIRDFRSDAEAEEYLFCNVAGEKLTENALKLAISDYNTARGVEKTSVHALRHTFSKCWIRNGGDAFRLQKMLGHSTLDMTRKYVNMFSDDLAADFDEVNPLNRIIKKEGVKHLIKKKERV